MQAALNGALRLMVAVTGWCGVGEAVVVGVALWCLGGVDGGWGCEVGGAVDELGGPFGGVEQGVVAGAEEDGVSHYLLV